MNSANIIDCFRYNMKFWNYLGVSPSIDNSYYNVYSKIFTTIFYFMYDFLPTMNLYFVPRVMDVIIEEMIFYFTEISVTFKVLTYYMLRRKIGKVLETLESNVFKPETDEARKIMNNAKKFIMAYWKIVAAVSVISNLTHVLSPLIMHLLSSTKLELPICGYFFLTESFKEEYIYILYFYQAVGMHFHMWLNVNTDSFILGLLILMIAQLDILDKKLRKVTDKLEGINEDNFRAERRLKEDSEIIFRLNKCFVHYREISKFCNLIEEIFSVSLFIQFSMASCIICVCLFRFTLPALWQYYIFLGTYMFIMIIQILVPCWFGTRVIEKSRLLSQAVYDCNWTSQSRRFKSSLRIFVVRANRPFTITGGKLFLLSLATFTSIMNSAYSFFTLLRHMQTRNG